MKILLSILFLLVILTEDAWSQAPFFKKHPLGEDHTEAKSVRIYQDRQSLIWVGTTNGLFRFDGLEFQLIEKNDEGSKDVTAIFQDSKMRMWAGFDDGNIYFVENGHLVKWMPEEGTPAKPITGFLEDGLGRFWFSTYGEGIYCFEDNGQRKRLTNFNSADGLPGDDIYVMVAAGKGRVAVGSDGGITFCGLTGGKKEIKTINTADGLPDNIVREILPDGKGNFWLGMYDEGFCFYDVEKQTFTHPVKNWSNNAVNHLELFEGRELWVGTEGSGVWRYSFFDKTVRQLDAGEDLQKSKVYDLLKDIEGNIWVLTNTHGICHANRQFEFIETGFENIQAVLSDEKSTLWIGTDNGLFTQYLDERGNSVFQRHLAHIPLNIISLYQDGFGNIWLGTFGQGIYIHNPTTGKVRHLTEKDGLTNGSILSMAGFGNKIWLATLGGAVEFSVGNDPLAMSPLVHRNFDSDNGLGTSFIYKVFIDSKGRTWFGTDGKGISVLDNGEITNFSHATHANGQHSGEPKQVELHRIYAITEDRRGHIWFCTAKEGIFEFDGKNFHHLTMKEGIRNLEITNLTATEKGEILIIHPTGIDLLTPESKHLIYYGKEIGVESLSPNMNAVCSDKDGNIWIGSERKLIRYTPLREKLSIHPRTLLNGLSIYLQPVDFKRKNIFEYDQNNLVFHYTGLWYTDPTTVQYKYMLEGFDHNWVTSKDRMSNYPNLPPGTYTFKITSTENAAYDDEPVVTYHFEVKAPLWERPWFVVICLLATGSFFYWLIKERERRLHRETLLKKEKIESQYEALKAQINPHFLFNSFNTLISIIEEEPEAAVKYVEHLSDFYRSILQYREKEVISLAEEFKVVKSYTQLLKYRYGDNLLLDIQFGNEATEHFIAPLTLQILVENAVKHNVISKSKPLTITIHPNGGGYIEVENNLQPKLDKPASTQFGLQSIVSCYALLTDKKVIIEKTTEHFMVGVPMINNSKL